MNPSQYNIAEELVEGVHSVFQGFHPGYRGVHANGRYYSGTFKATPEAKQLSRAIHLQGEVIPVTVRHSNSVSGSPWGPSSSVSMATKFYLPNGTITDLIALPIPVFLGRDPEEVLELLKLLKPDAATGEFDMEKLMGFLSTRPSVANALNIAKNMPGTLSFAQTTFHALHAFCFVNEANEKVYARYHWEPEAGQANQSLEDLMKLPSSYLYDELEARLQNGPVVFSLVLQMAEPGDQTHDPTSAWPEDRRRIKIGELKLIRSTTIEEIGDPVMMHDPTKVTDGIELSDDPILAARRGIYEVSVAQRTGGWKGRMAALERGGCPFS